MTSHDALRRSLKFKLKLILSENKILVQTIEEYVKKAEAVYRDTESLDKIPTGVFKKAMARLETAYSACIKMVLLASDLFEADKKQQPKLLATSVSMSQCFDDSSCADSLRSVDKDTMRRLASLERKFQSYLALRGQEAGSGRKSLETRMSGEAPATGAELYQRMMAGQDKADMYVPADPVIELRRFLYGLDCTPDDGYRDPRIVFSNERKQFPQDARPPIALSPGQRRKQTHPSAGNVAMSGEEGIAGDVGGGAAAGAGDASTECLQASVEGDNLAAPRAGCSAGKTGELNGDDRGHTKDVVHTIHPARGGGRSEDGPEDLSEAAKASICSRRERSPERDLLESLLTKLEQGNTPSHHQQLSPRMYGGRVPRQTSPESYHNQASSTSITMAAVSPIRTDRHVGNTTMVSPRPLQSPVDGGTCQSMPRGCRNATAHKKSPSPPGPTLLRTREPVAAPRNRSPRTHTRMTSPAKRAAHTSPRDEERDRSCSAGRCKDGLHHATPAKLIQKVSTGPQSPAIHYNSGAQYMQPAIVQNKPDDHTSVRKTDTQGTSEGEAMELSQGNFQHILERIGGMERFLEQEISTERDLLTKCLDEFQKILKSNAVDDQVTSVECDEKEDGEETVSLHEQPAAKTRKRSDNVKSRPVNPQQQSEDDDIIPSSTKSPGVVNFGATADSGEKQPGGKRISRQRSASGRRINQRPKPKNRKCLQGSSDECKASKNKKSGSPVCQAVNHCDTITCKKAHCSTNKIPSSKQTRGKARQSPPSLAVCESEEFSCPTGSTETNKDSENTVTVTSRNERRVRTGKTKTNELTDTETFTNKKKENNTRGKKGDSYGTQPTTVEAGVFPLASNCSNAPSRQLIPHGTVNQQAAEKNNVNGLGTEANVERVMKGLVDTMLKRIRTHVLKASVSWRPGHEASTGEDDSKTDDTARVFKPDKQAGKVSPNDQTVKENTKEAGDIVEDDSRISKGKEGGVLREVNLLDLDTSLHQEVQTEGGIPLAARHSISPQLLEPVRLPPPLAGKSPPHSNQVSFVLPSVHENVSSWPSAPVSAFKTSRHFSPQQKPLRAHVNHPGMSGPVTMTGRHSIQQEKGACFYQLPASVPSQHIYIGPLPHGRQPINPPNQIGFVTEGFQQKQPVFSDTTAQQGQPQHHPVTHYDVEITNRCNIDQQDQCQQNVFAGEFESVAGVCENPTSYHKVQLPTGPGEQYSSNPQGESVYPRFQTSSHFQEQPHLQQTQWGMQQQELQQNKHRAEQQGNFSDQNVETQDLFDGYHEPGQQYRLNEPHLVHQPNIYQPYHQTRFSSGQKPTSVSNVNNLPNTGAPADHTPNPFSSSTPGLPNSCPNYGWSPQVKWTDEQAPGNISSTPNPAIARTSVHAPVCNLDQGYKNLPMSPSSAAAPVFSTPGASLVSWMNGQSPHGGIGASTLSCASNGFNGIQEPTLQSGTSLQPGSRVVNMTSDAAANVSRVMTQNPNAQPPPIGHDPGSRLTSVLNSSMVAPTRLPTSAATTCQPASHAYGGQVRRLKSRSRSSLGQSRTQRVASPATTAGEDQKKSSAAESGKTRGQKVYVTRRATSQGSYSRTKAENRTVCITNLPAHLEEMSLLKVLNQHGYVSKIYFIKHRNTGEFQGTAYVKFRQCEEAESARAALNSLVLDGQKVSASMMARKE